MHTVLSAYSTVKTRNLAIDNRSHVSCYIVTDIALICSVTGSNHINITRNSSVNEIAERYHLNHSISVKHYHLYTWIIAPNKQLLLTISSSVHTVLSVYSTVKTRNLAIANRSHVSCYIVTDIALICSVTGSNHINITRNSSVNEIAERYHLNHAISVKHYHLYTQIIAPNNQLLLTISSSVHMNTKRNYDNS